MPVGSEGKAELRTRMRTVRASIPSDERGHLSDLACARALALPELRMARTVALYCAFGTELSLATLVRELGQRDGVTLLAPVTLIGRGLAFVPVDAGELLVPVGELPAFLAHPERPLGAVPAGRKPIGRAEIDVMLVPGLAFDGLGMRLGYGAGYYDAWLDENGARAGSKWAAGGAVGAESGQAIASAHHASHAADVRAPEANPIEPGLGRRALVTARPLTVGICFDEQLTERVPAEPHDRPVAVVVTPTRTLRAPACTK